MTVMRSWLRWLALGLSSRGPGFDPRSVHVRFEVNHIALGQVSLRVRQRSPTNIIPPMLHIHLQLHVALTRRTNRRSLETLQKALVFPLLRSIG
jgi:hypothetical protein